MALDTLYILTFSLLMLERLFLLACAVAASRVQIKQECVYIDLLCVDNDITLADNASLVFPNGAGTAGYVLQAAACEDCTLADTDPARNRAFIGGSSLPDTCGNDSLSTQDLCVRGDLTVDGNTNLAGDLEVGGNTNLTGDLDVGGNSNLAGNLTVEGTLSTSEGPCACGSAGGVGSAKIFSVGGSAPSGSFANGIHMAGNYRDPTGAYVIQTDNTALGGISLPDPHISHLLFEFSGDVSENGANTDVDCTFEITGRVVDEATGEVSVSATVSFTVTTSDLLWQTSAKIRDCHRHNGGILRDHGDGGDWLDLLRRCRQHGL